MIAALSTRRYARLVPALLVAASLTVPAWAQTKIVAPKNSYSLQEDVKLGQEAAQEVRRELPMLSDDRVDDYVEDVGRRLVDAIPSEFRYGEFRYTFDVVNQEEINAFALPGGPMFLNRGMIEAAKSEGEMAGVMAHEISHVALRHGTAQATKSQPWAIGSAVGQILGGILGGGLGQVVATGSQIIPGLKLMQYSRDYERQADLLGAQILARAGYDPREMANMFRTIEAEGGGGGPEWMSSHPNPGNRYNAIIAESKSLRIQGNANANSGNFRSIQGRLNGMSPALTAEQIARGQGGNRPTSTAPRTVRVDPPSTAFRTHQPANFLRVSVPSNWQPVNGTSNGVTYTPEGAFFRDGNATAFTHGVQIGVVQGSGNLARDTQQILNGFAQSNPELRQEGQPRRDTVAGRNGLTTVLSNTSEVTGARERIAFSTTQLRDGNVLFIVGVAPQSDANSYDSTFRRVRQSVQISDNR